MVSESQEDILKQDNLTCASLIRPSTLINSGHNSSRLETVSAVSCASFKVVSVVFNWPCKPSLVQSGHAENDKLSQRRENLHILTKKNKFSFNSRACRETHKPHNQNDSPRQLSCVRFLSWLFTCHWMLFSNQNYGWVDLKCYWPNTGCGLMWTLLVQWQNVQDPLHQPLVS